MPTLTVVDRIRFADLAISVVSTDTAAEMFYFGSQKYADAEVLAAGDLVLSHGASLAAKIGDTDIGSPTLTGTFDLSTPAAAVDTYGELFDLANKSPNWRIKPGAVRRADKTDNTLIALAATQCNQSVVSLLRDTTSPVQTTTYTIGVRVSAGAVNGPNDSGWINNITTITGVATATAGSGAGYNDGEGALDGIRVVVYAVNDILKTQRRLWASATIATTVAFSYGVTDWGGNPLSGFPEEALLVLIQNSGTGATTITSPSLTVKGYRTAVESGRLGRWSESNQ
jgi:hypothetical protein